MSNALALLLLAGGGVAIYAGIKGVSIQTLLDQALRITGPQAGTTAQAGPAALTGAQAAAASAYNDAGPHPINAVTGPGGKA